MQEKFHAIIVDDDPVLNILMKNLIKMNDLHSDPVSFENGVLLLSYLAENYKEASTYLIFLDINMQPLNGWDVLEGIAKIAKPENTMIFIVSSSTDESDKDRAKDNEFVIEYLTKPVFASTIVQVKDIVRSRTSIMS